MSAAIAVYVLGLLLIVALGLGVASFEKARKTGRKPVRG